MFVSGCLLFCLVCRVCLMRLLLFVVCCSLFEVCRLLCVVGSLSFVVRCWWSGARY